MSRRDTLNMPYAFLGNETFRLLQTYSGEDAAPLIGRLIMLASVVATQNRVKFHVAEIDSLTAWRAPIPFATILERVGWCSKPEKLSVKLSLPADLQKLSPRSLAGKDRVKKAERDQTGRWKRLEGATKEDKPTEAPKARYPERPLHTVDSEGNIIRSK